MLIAAEQMRAANAAEAVLIDRWADTWQPSFYSRSGPNTARQRLRAMGQTVATIERLEPRTDWTGLRWIAYVDLDQADEIEALGRTIAIRGRKGHKRREPWIETFPSILESCRLELRPILDAFRSELARQMEP